MAELLAGSTPLVLCLTVRMIALALLLLLIVRPVVKKTRPEDVPATLFGLGYVMACLSAYLPWGKWRTSSHAQAATAVDGQASGTAP
ncbi:hypothetical protein ABVB25_42205, partial [Streptomyces anthocyanicus]